MPGPTGQFVVPPDSFDPHAVATGSAPTFSEGQRVILSTDLSGNLRVAVSGGGSAVSIADGSDVCEGSTTDAAVVGDVTGTISAKLRGISKILNSVWSSVNGWFLVAAGGQGAAAATVVGNPIRNGALGRSTLPTSVSSAQLVDILLDRYGRQYMIRPIVTNASSAGTAITTNTNTQLIAAPSAGNHLRIYSLWAQNSSSVGTWAYWGNGSGVKTFPFYMAQNQPFSRTFNGAWELSTATGLFMNTATTGANVEWYVEYETLTD